MLNKKRKTVSLLVIFSLALSAAFGSIFFMTGQTQAASAVTLTLTPVSSTFTVGQIFTVDILLNTGGVNIDGVDLFYLHYDPALLQVQDANLSVAGIQITEGTLFGQTMANVVDPLAGKITFSQITTRGTAFNGSGKLASISFKAQATGTASVSFDFTYGKTNDTNVSGAGIDQLTSVANASYTITNSTAACPGSIPTNSFLGCYYDNMDGTGFVLSRIDPAINFSWGTGSPSPAMGADTFYARWEGDFSFNLGSYNFTAASDDGLRLYIDNILFINQWNNQPLTSFTATRNMSSGTHRIKFEYFENGGAAGTSLSWNSGFVGQYWNAGTGSYPAIPTTAPTLTRLDPTLNFNWGQGSPDPIINPNHFIAVWTKTESLSAANYEFSVTADDGVRLYVDNVLLIDQWKDQAPTTYKVTKTLSAGNHLLKLQYYENGDAAVAKLSWQVVAGLPSTGTSPHGATPWYLNGLGLAILALISIGLFVIWTRFGKHKN